MKKISVFLAIFLFAIMFVGTGCTSSNFRETKTLTNKVLFNKDWKFIIDSTGISNPSDLSIPDDEWHNAEIPHTPKIEPLVVNNQWQGQCWYKKTFNFNPQWKNKKLFLRFEGAMNVAEVWVNGNKKTTHLGGYLPFVIDITDDLQKDAANIVYVKLNNEDNPITGPKPLDKLDFNTYGGIYRDVFLITKNKIYITDEQYANVKAGGGILVSFPKVDAEKSVISVQTHVSNSTNTDDLVIIRQSVEKEGVVIVYSDKEINLKAGEDKHVAQKLIVENPELWSPKVPALYNLVTTISKEGKLLDKEDTKIGIRKFEFVNNKLYLNGQEIFLRGVNRHQEYPYVGYAISRNADYRDAYKIKMGGFDYVRLSHYPHSKNFIDACDELGVVVIDAILGWQFYNDDEAFRQHVFQSARDMIRRDRNHPSILAWEVSLNESWMPEEFIDSLVLIAKEEFPNEDCYTAGWQSYGYDIYLQARQHRIGDNEHSFPDKPYVVSEYGDWEYYAMNAGLNQNEWGDLLEEERSSRQLLGSGEKRLLQQARNIQEAHNDNFNTPAVADGYWVMFDYNRGYTNDLEASGVMSIFRLPKFSYYLYQSQRDAFEPISFSENKPMVFIASHMEQGLKKDIRVFSNCQEVELIKNGENLGKQKPDIDRYSKDLSNAPFTFNNIDIQNDTLIALGIIDSKVAVEHRISTPGTPVKILLEADLSGKSWMSGCKDAIFVYAKVVDENNQLVYNYDNPITFSLEGNAKIIGDMTNFPEAGIASALIMAGDVPSDIQIFAQSPGFGSEPFKISTIPCNKVTELE